MAKTVIHPKRLPMRLPINPWTPLTLWLVLDRLQPEGWVWGVCWTCYFLLLIVAWAIYLNESYRDPFPGAD